MKTRGFTLIELIIVVIVLGVMVTMTYVSYTAHRRRTELRGATAQIQAIVAAEKLYYLNFRIFSPTTSTATTNTNLGLRVQDGRFDNYRVNVLAGTFTVDVNSGNAVYTFNDHGVQTGCSGSDCV